MGCTAFLEKPLQARALLEALERYAGIRWQIAQSSSVEESTTDVTDIAVPPPEILKILQRSAQRGNIEELLHQLHHLQHDPNLAIFCTQALAFVQEFKLRALKNFLAQFQ